MLCLQGKAQSQNAPQLSNASAKVQVNTSRQEKPAELKALDKSQPKTSELKSNKKAAPQKAKLADKNTKAISEKKED